jgi:hypothetical protein
MLFNLEGQLRDSSKGWLVVYTDFEGDIYLLIHNISSMFFFVN